MNWRYRFVLFCFLSFFIIVITRLFYWQIVKADELSLLGASQYGKFIKLYPKRGEIRTSDGFSIAANKLSYLVFANPKEVKEKDKTAQFLADLLHGDRASISAELTLDRLWVPVAGKVDEQTKENLEKLQIPGVGFEETYSRFYPEASLSAQLIGFVGKNSDGSDKGYFGLEGFYDRQLKGKEGFGTTVSDVFGRPILAKMNGKQSAIDGRSLLVSVDRAVQFIAENSLKDGVEKYGAADGMVGIINPTTGEILAMAASPTFDPTNYQDYSLSDYKNPFISNLYEPGSTFKSIVMASALDANVVKPDTKCTICDKPVSIGGYDIHTWNDKYEKDINMIDVIKNSDNTGMVFVSQKLGLPRMLSYFDKFGIGQLTGIDLEGEVSSDLKPIDQWYPIDAATAAFGQGISVTPLQILDAFSALANNGIRMEPHVVSKIETADGQTIDIAPKELDRPVSEATAKVMTEILVNAVNNGEAKFARLKGYRIAGKTGTAQIPIAGHYDPTKTIASFIGFAPADNPKFAMLVIIDRPTTSIYGAETAAPIFFDITKKLFDYYQIPPTEPTDGK